MSARRLGGAALAVAALAMVGVGGCSKRSGSTAELCTTAASGSFTDLFRQGFDPTDTQRALAQLHTASIDLEQLRSAAPSEVKAAVADEAAYVDALTKVLKDTDPNDEDQVVQRINALSKERAAAQAGSTKLTEYQRTHCTTTTRATTASG